MDSDDDGFAKQGGEALDLNDDDLDDSEQDESSDAEPNRKPLGGFAAHQGEEKGQKVENQPFDVAVDVDDSEEIESDEEDDEVNVDVNVGASATQA